MALLSTPLHKADAIGQLLEQEVPLPTYSIGRHSDNTICLPNRTISSHHARLVGCTPTSYLLEDLDSKNGTYVNGIRISRKLISETDAIRLADTDVTVPQLLNQAVTAKPQLSFSTPSAANKTAIDLLKPQRADAAGALDVSVAFAELKQVFEQYPQLRKACRNREKMIRTGSIILSSVVGISAVLASGGIALSLLQVMSGAGLSMLVPTLCSTLLSTDEKLELIDKEYRDRYRCPNPACRDPFGMREWELLAQQKTCRRCQAVWVK